jgi:hypothetical protein
MTGGFACDFNAVFISLLSHNTATTSCQTYLTTSITYPDCHARIERKVVAVLRRHQYAAKSKISQMDRMYMITRTDFTYGTSLRRSNYKIAPLILIIKVGKRT